MGSRLSGLGGALYDSKRREFLGRDGAGWGKLGVFYFFFYIGLAGFFCAMLAVFMALSPRDRPRYYLASSRMRTRSNPLSPGLGFRPQPEVDKNLIFVDKNSDDFTDNLYVRSLDQYLNVYYWKNDEVKKKESGQEYQVQSTSSERKFSIRNPGECKNDTQYGFSRTRPCVLVKMNKIVEFIPQPPLRHDKDALEAAKCPSKSGTVPVHCYGEYPADVDNIGPINYISEDGSNSNCGTLKVDWFPYKGKYDREDVYQAPYIWVQFMKPKQNVLINVLCRVYGDNIDFDKKSGRALTRFQIYVQNLPKDRKSGKN